MNKEEAKEEFKRWFNPDGLVGHSLIMEKVDQLIDAIEPEHKPVVLPKKVGKQWTKLVIHYWSSQSADDIWSGANYALGRLRALGELDRDYGDLTHWWANTKDSYTQLVDAARYGWVPEAEKRYRVVMKMPGQGHQKLYAEWDATEGTRIDWVSSFKQADSFKLSEITKFGLQDCEREEVQEYEKD